MDKRGKVCYNPFSKLALAKKGETIMNYRHTYHLMADEGWINDPNGFIYFNGYYHCFYQYSKAPDGASPRLWGHARSKDLVKWETLPLALVPDKPYDKNGCWSGGAIVKDGVLWLVYTGQVNTGGDPSWDQTINLAYSTDGVTFIKPDYNPVISRKNMPEGTSTRDFRDPYVFERNGEIFVMVGTTHGIVPNGTALVQLYKTKNLVDFSFVGEVIRGKEYSAMCECPSYVWDIDGKDILFVSCVSLPPQEFSFYNYNSSVALIGKLDYDTGAFTHSGMNEVDFGLDFYAPQTTVGGDGTKVMIAWMNMWNRDYPTASQGWTGAMILPRETYLVDGMLATKPISAIKNYYQNELTFDKTITGVTQIDGVQGNVLHLKISVDMQNANVFSVRFFADEMLYTKFEYDKRTGVITCDRSKNEIFVRSRINEKSGNGVRRMRYLGNPEKLEAEFFLDVSSVEAFFGDGRSVMSTLTYNGERKGVYFETDGTARITGVKHDIVVK